MDHTTPPTTDPTPLFELFRGNHATELLVAAVAHFDVFARLAGRPMTLDELGAELGLADRPSHVLVTALRAMGCRLGQGYYLGKPMALDALAEWAATTRRARSAL